MKGKFIYVSMKLTTTNRHNLYQQAEITQALQGSFLLQSLSEKQRQMLIECMYVVEVEAGDIVIRQVKLKLVHI